MKENDVVQFNENHKWRGSLGIIREIKTIHKEFHPVTKISSGE